MDFISHIGDRFTFDFQGVKYLASVRMINRYDNENYVCVTLMPKDPSGAPQPVVKIKEFRPLGQEENPTYAICREVVDGDNFTYAVITNRGFSDFILQRMIKQCKAVVRDQREDFAPYDEPDYE